MRKRPNAALCTMIALTVLLNAAGAFAASSRLSIVYPGPDQVTASDRLIVTGNVLPKNEKLLLKINGKNISYSKNGSFVTSLILRPGKNLAVFSVSVDGKTTQTAYRKILRMVRFSDSGSTYKGGIHWAEKYIIRAATLGIIEGYPDGSFLPDNNLTKAEFASWIAKAAGLAPVVVTKDLYFDLPKDHWRAPYIKAAIDSGLVQAVNDKYFGTEDPISRADAAETVLKANGFNKEPEPGRQFFTDVPLTDKKNRSVSIAAEKGLVLGISKNPPVYDPERDLTRAEAAAMISRLSGVKEAFDEINDWGRGFDGSTICHVNAVPVIERLESSPDAAVADGRTKVLITAHANDPDGISDITLAKIDLQQVGGPSDAVMYDDGTNGDLASRDAVYSISLPINPDVAPGKKLLTATITDKSGVQNEKELYLTVLSPNSPPAILSSLAYPPAVRPGKKTSLAVKVFDADGTGDISSVSADLSKLGGPANQPLYDDGTNGDYKGGDGIFMLDLTVPEGTPSGEYQLDVTVADKKGGTSVSRISLMVR